MAGKKISQLPPIASPALTDILAAVQTGTTGQETLQAILNLFTSNLGTITNLTVTNLTVTNETAGNITFSSTSGIIGTTTNNNAAAGSVGEYVTANAATGSVSVTTDTGTDVCSISLTAGDWDIFGNVVLGFTGNATQWTCWTSLTSATPPTSDKYSIIQVASGLVTISGNAPFLRVSLAGTTTVYLSCVGSFTTGTCHAGGNIYARRRR
jgi:hypothetical protein